MSEERLRDVVEFVADWAHDCSPSNAATPWDRKHGDEIDPRSYGFDDIEERCRAALTASTVRSEPDALSEQQKAAIWDFIDGFDSNYGRLIGPLEQAVIERETAAREKRDGL